MPRIPLPGPDEMSPAQRKVYDAIVSGPRGKLVGPLRAALHNPELAEKWQQFGALLRYGTSLPPRLSELAILVTARHFDCQLEWQQHAPIALANGISPQVAEAIRHAQEPVFVADDEASVYAYSRELHETHFASDSTYQRALQQLGNAGLVELTALLGYYAMVAMTLNAHQIPLPDGAAGQLPSRSGLAEAGKGMAAASPVSVRIDGKVAQIVIDNPPVNASSIDVRRGLLRAIDQVSGDPLVKAAVIIGAGNTFIAGSDIREFDRPIEDPQLPEVIAAIEGCPKPVVAALHGAALGGGLELALGCDARVISSNGVIGLPEVTLGMIPGAGGTQRVPRLAGLPAAIEMICSGRRLKAGEALEMHLVDQVVDGDLASAASTYALALSGKKRNLRATPVPPSSAIEIEAAVTAATKKGRSRPQVRAAIEAIRSAASIPFDDALGNERKVFQSLRTSDEAAALRHLFFAEREAGKVAGVRDIPAMPVRRVAVIGAGTMGAGIAACFADGGFPVTVVETDTSAAERGQHRIAALYDRLAQSGRISETERDSRLAQIVVVTDLSRVATCDLIVEAVFEDFDVKVDLFRRLDSIVRPDAILASNTSYLNLDAIAASTANPARIVGLHFFSPANVMRLLEIVRTQHASSGVLATALAVAKKLRKLAVVARVGEGFIGNRIYAAYRRQCEFMLEEGAWPEQIDKALTAFGFAMGPFAVSDMSGLDIAWQMRKRLAATRDPRERYVDIADRLCEAGRLGQKTGAGWYRYEQGARQGTPDPFVRKLIEDASTEKGVTRRSFSDAEIVRRVIASMVNEAALVMQARVAARASDIDLVLVNGYGFPNYHGGPLFYAGRQDRGQLLADLDDLVRVSGYGFQRGDLLALSGRIA